MKILAILKKVTSQLPKLLSVVAVAGLFSGSAMAAHITGEFSYSTSFIPVNAAGTQVALGAATGLDFDLDDSVAAFPLGVEVGVGSVVGSIDTQTGSFAPITSVNILDLVINPFAGNSGNLVGVWAATGAPLLFGLNSLNIAFQTDSAIVINGIGQVLDYTGVDLTPCAGTGAGLTNCIAGLDGVDASEYLWDFTGNQTGGTINFSATQAPAPAPEPSALGLMGLGMLSVGLLARRRKAARPA